MNIKARIGISVAVIATVLALFLAIAAIAGPEDKPNVCQNLCEAYKDSGCCNKPDDPQCLLTKSLPWQFNSCQASNDNKKIQDLACNAYSPCKPITPILPPIGAKSQCKIKCTYGDNQVTTQTSDGSRCCLYDSDNSKFVAPDDVCNGAIEKQEAFIKKDFPTGKVKCELDGPVATSITCKLDPKCNKSG